MSTPGAEHIHQDVHQWLADQGFAPPTEGGSYVHPSGAKAYFTKDVARTWVLTGYADPLIETFKQCATDAVASGGSA